MFHVTTHHPTNMVVPSNESRPQCCPTSKPLLGLTLSPIQSIRSSPPSPPFLPRPKQHRNMKLASSPGIINTAAITAWPSSYRVTKLTHQAHIPYFAKHPDMTPCDLLRKMGEGRKGTAALRRCCSPVGPLTRPTALRKETNGCHGGIGRTRIK